jgi:AcrR family transcriptional regulator
MRAGKIIGGEGSGGRPSSDESRDTSVALAPRVERRSAQRERLLQAMIELAAERGSREATVAAISARAGVSSATFYEQFDNKEECFAAAYRASAARILAGTSRATAQITEQRTHSMPVLHGVIQTLMSSIQQEPDAARVLFVEGLSGAPRLREESSRVLSQMQSRTEAAIDAMAAEAGPVDVPAIALVGAVRNIVARRLRVHAEDRLLRLVEPLAEWVVSYKLPAGALRWTTKDHHLPARETDLAAPKGGGADSHERRRLPRGRHGLSPSEVIRSQRTRIIAATAEVTMAKGYGATTVADIVASAGVAKDAFYEHFRDKEDAFLEAQHHPTQFILDRCAEAYFHAPDWPRRLWNHLEMLVQMIVENPAISHLRLVECYAAGPAAVRRAEEITQAFNIFLEEGYGYEPGVPERPHLFSEAITGAIFEVIRNDAARGETARLLERVPQLTYLGLAPFVGASRAIELVEGIAGAPATADA